jgi:hypothetical protein
VYFTALIGSPIQVSLATGFIRFLFVMARRRGWIGNEALEQHLHNELLIQHRIEYQSRRSTRRFLAFQNEFELLVQQRGDEGDEFINNNLLVASVSHFPFDRIEKFCFFINVQFMF